MPSLLIEIMFLAMEMSAHHQNYVTCISADDKAWYQNTELVKRMVVSNLNSETTDIDKILFLKRI